MAEKIVMYRRQRAILVSEHEGIACLRVGVDEIIMVSIDECDLIIPRRTPKHIELELEPIPHRNHRHGPK